MLLAAIKDVNDPIVRRCIEEDEVFSGIIGEIENLSRNKEVQIMMLTEKFAAMDLASMRAEERAEGRNSGISESIKKLADHYISTGAAKSKEEAVKMATAILK